MAADALVIVQRMIDTFAADKLTMYQLLRTTKALAIGTASYTVGSGGAINIVRPDKIEDAKLVRNSAAADPVEDPIDVFTPQRWAAIPVKTLDGDPEGVFYDRGWTAGLAMLSLYPIPNAANRQLVLYTMQALIAFADLSTTDYTFPRGYEAAFHYQLAVDLAIEFGRPISDDLRLKQRLSRETIERGNVQPRELSVDAALLAPAGFDIWRGPY
jgi:hypothetical protein